MTLVGDLSKGSLGASKVSVSLRVLSIRSSKKKKKKNNKKKNKERRIYALFACFCFPGCYAKRFMFPSRRGVPACASMHRNPPGVKVASVAS